MYRIVLSDPVEFLGCRISFEDQEEPLEKLQLLHGQKQAKGRQQTLAKVEFEEQLRFFNRPRAKADVTHWSKATYWTLEEAISLLFGKAPEVVTWKGVKEYCGSPQCPGSPFAVKYGRVRDLVLRAKAWKQLSDPVLPSIFLAWARRMEIEVPGELIEQVEKHGIVIADWKDLYDKLKEQFDKVVGDRDKIASICKIVIEERDELKHTLEATQSTASDAPLGESERDSLLKMVLGMAMAAYDYKPGANRNTATGEKQGSVSVDLQRMGLTLDADTVRKFTKEAETRFKDIIQNPHKS